jgi:hypothetical protein
MSGRPRLEVRLSATGIGLLGILLAALAQLPSPAAAAVPTVHDGELVANGAWSWFQDPRALHYVGAHDRTYIGYVTSAGDVDVVSQDAGTATLVQTTLHAHFDADDHAAPGLVVLPDGRIAVFYTAHGGLQMLYRISTRPEDITDFGPEQVVVSSPVVRPLVYRLALYTYANPIYLSAEHRLYLFFRGGDYRPQMTWTTDYVHWSPAVDLVVPDNEPPLTRPYVKYATNGIDTIDITFTDGHPREVTRNSVYAMVYKGGILWTPDNKPVTVIDPTEVTDHTLTVPHTGAMHTDWLRPATTGLVYNDPGGAVAWLQSIAMAPDGAPVIVYSTYADNADAQYYYARWNGTTWTTAHITDAGGPLDPNEVEYSGGASLDQNDPGHLYLSRETAPGSAVWEVEDWRTSDSGASFTQTSVITPNPTVKNVRPVVPWGPPGEIQMLWMSGTYTGYFGAQFNTQLRELTTGLAPTTARISTSATSINPGAALQIGARIVQGYQGAPVGAATIQLLGHTSGEPDQILRQATADATGYASFTIYPEATMRFTVRMQPSSTYGGSISPSVVVTVRRPSTVRISTTATTVQPGHPVTVGARAVDARTGIPISGAQIELWQLVTGTSWQRIGSYTASSLGLIQVIRTPGTTVTYQARLLSGPTNLASNSPTVVVRVT